MKRTMTLLWAAAMIGVTGPWAAAAEKAVPARLESNAACAVGATLDGTAVCVSWADAGARKTAVSLAFFGGAPDGENTLLQEFAFSSLDPGHVPAPARVKCHDGDPGDVDGYTLCIPLEDLTVGTCEVVGEEEICSDVPFDVTFADYLKVRVRGVETVLMLP